MEKIGKYFITISKDHLDLFGHVNFINYYKFFDAARWEFSTKNGFDLDMVKKNQEGPILLEQNAKFLREIKLDEVVEIQTKVIEHSEKHTKVIQSMIKSCGKVASEIRFTIGYFDMKKRRLIGLSPEWKNSTPIYDYVMNSE